MIVVGGKVKGGLGKAAVATNLTIILEAWSSYACIKLTGPSVRTGTQKLKGTFKDIIEVLREAQVARVLAFLDTPVQSIRCKAAGT
jgi:hypothetical protein